MIAQELKEKIEKAGRALQLAAKMSKEYYDKPLIVTYSGGKDSDALLHVALEYLEPDEFEVLNSHTTVDAPETVYHIRETFEMLEEGGGAYRSTDAALQGQAYNDVGFDSAEEDTANKNTEVLLSSIERVIYSTQVHSNRSERR